MVSTLPYKEYFICGLTSTDQSTGVAASLLDPATRAAVAALGSTDQIVVQTVEISELAATVLCGVYNSTSLTPTQLEAVAYCRSTLTTFRRFIDGYLCQPGVGLVIKAATAGQVDVIITGYIIRQK